MCSRQRMLLQLTTFKGRSPLPSIVRVAAKEAFSCLCLGLPAEAAEASQKRKHERKCPCSLHSGYMLQPFRFFRYSARHLVTIRSHAICEKSCGSVQSVGANRAQAERFGFQGLAGMQHCTLSGANLRAALVHSGRLYRRAFHSKIAPSD